MKNYLLLEKEIDEISQLGNIIKMLSWDMAVNMPLGSATSRSNEISSLNSIICSRLKSNKINELLNAADKEIDYLDVWQRSNLKEVKKTVQYANCIDVELQQKHIAVVNTCELVWREARKNNDFNKLKPFMQEVLNYTQEIASLKASMLNCSKYEALVDEYDPNRTTKELNQISICLINTLPGLIKEVVEKQKAEPVLPIPQVPINQQKMIGKKIMEIMMFDFDKGRLDESTHPFCGGTAFDTRITNRYKDDDFISGLMGIVHETGHALYEQNLPSNYKNQPVGRAKGMAIHESQSLLMEMQIGRSKEFCEFLSKLLKDEFNLKGAEYSLDNLYKLNTRVKPSLIRVDADEVTYPLHVILRFEIEELLINNELRLEDVPSLWKKKMKEYLGITPDTNRDGLLQDIHWPRGLFGYFPAYNNGAIIASMLMKVIKETEGSMVSQIAEGNFKNLNTFLNTKIRNYGSSKYSDDLIKDATNEEGLKPEIFLLYLKEKYLN